MGLSVLEWAGRQHAATAVGFEEVRTDLHGAISGRPVAKTMAGLRVHHLLESSAIAMLLFLVAGGNVVTVIEVGGDIAEL